MTSTHHAAAANYRAVTAADSRPTAEAMLRDIAFVLEMTRRMRADVRPGRPAAPAADVAALAASV